MATLRGLGVDGGTAVVEGQQLHPELGVVNYRAMDIGNDPDGQVARTVGVMGERVRQDSQDPQFRQWADGVLGQGSNWEKIQRAFDHTKAGIRFEQDAHIGAGVGDIPQDELVEVIVRPLDMMGYVQQGNAVGDCDDFSMYCAALLESQGIPCKFVTVAADGRDPNQYSHVYVAAYPDGERVAMDTSHGSEPGWEVPNRYGKYREWAIGGGPSLLGEFVVMVAASMLGSYVVRKMMAGGIL